MAGAGITSNDLAQALRSQTNQEDPSKVRRAYLERDGSISVIPREAEPRIVDTSIADGVQTVRIKLE